MNDNMYKQIDIFAFIEPREPMEPKKTLFEQMFSKINNPIVWCVNCLCEYCANNAEATSDKVKAGEQKMPCFNCEECWQYTGERTARRLCREECDNFLISNYGAMRNQRQIKIIK